MTASTSASATPTLLRIVVYCDDVTTPQTLADVRLPRDVEEVRRLVEGKVGKRATILSYWNFARQRYELLRDVHELLQPDGRLLAGHPRRSTTAAAAAAAGGTDGDGTDSGAASAGELDAAHTKARLYRCQLWMETVLVQLEPLDPQRDELEYEELCRHVARWLGNKHVGFEVRDAVRIRCPFLTRMFDETRSTRLMGNRDKVQLLYYSNNAWSVRDVLQYGFLLHTGVPTSLAAVLQSCAAGPSTSEGSSGTESRLSIPVPASVPATPATVNTQRNPFVFTSSMLSPHVRHLPDKTEPHKVLLCEVAPGRRFMTDQGLTGEHADKQAFPTTAVRTPRGYDSTCYMRARKQKSSLRTEKAADVAVEDLSLVQVQVRHSYQALPRYLITVVPSGAPPPPTPISQQQELTREGGGLRSATASPLRPPGTTAQIAAAYEDEKKMCRAAGLPVPPPPPALPELPDPPPSTPKSYNMKQWFKSGSHPHHSHASSQPDSAYNTPGHAEFVSAADAHSPRSSSAGAAVREVRYANSDLSPRRRAASVATPHRHSYDADGAASSGRRHVGFQGDSDSELAGGVRSSRSPLYSSAVGGGGGDSPSRPVWVADAGQVAAAAAPAAAGASGGLDPPAVPRVAPSASYFPHPTGRAASVPRLPLAPPLPSPVRPTIITDAGAQRGVAGWASSDYLAAAALPHSSSSAPRNGLLYEGLHHAAASGGAADRPGNAVSRPPLLPTQGPLGSVTYLASQSIASPMSTARRAAGRPMARTAAPARGPLDAPASAVAPPAPPPAAFNQFLCPVHPRQVQSLYCTACDELTCPYCASVGTHRDHVVVEADEKATAVRAEAEALHEELRHWLMQYRKTEQELRVEQGRYAARQQRELRSLQQRLMGLKQALHQSERVMVQAVQESQCRPPLAEAAAVVRKYTEALNPIDMALRRYHSSVTGHQDANAPAADRSRAVPNSVPELLHFLRTTPSLIHKVQGSFVRHHKEEERRLRDAVVDYDARAQRSEALFEHVDWVGLRRLLENLGTVHSGRVPPADGRRSASPAGRGARDESPPRGAASLFVPPSGRRGDPHSRPSSATTRVRSRSPGVAPASAVFSTPPRSGDGSAVSRRLLNSPPLRARSQHHEGDVLSSPGSARGATPPATAGPSPRRDRRLHRCLTDLQRGYIWVVQNATAYFAPGQPKAVCSTPFRLLGAMWELRIAPLPRASRTHAASAPVTPMLTAGAAGVNVGTVASAASHMASPTSLNGGGAFDDEGGGGGAAEGRVSPLITRATADDLGFGAEGGRAHASVTVVPPSELGEEEWLGLFLFPLQHRMRVDFRAIAFSEVTWTEWHVTGWTPLFAGKGWGLFPFLQRKELMRTDKLARENTVKICIAPISDLY